MTIEDLVEKFLKDEKLPLKNTLAYGGLGLSKSSGAINEIVTDIVFSGHVYSSERKQIVAEQLGEMMFYWHVIASTVDISIEEILDQYVSLYLVKNNQISSELNVSIVELMKHVKVDAKMQEIDADKKKRTRDMLNESQRLQNEKANERQRN